MSNEKVIWSESGGEIGTDQAPFTSQISSKQICGWILMWQNNRRWTFSLEEVLLWIMDLYFSWKQQFEVKNVLMDLFLQTRSFCLHNILTDGLEES